MSDFNYENETLQKSCPICHKNNETEVSICDNDCGTIFCDCENVYYVIDDKYSSGHNPDCGKDNFDDDYDIDFNDDDLEVLQKINNFDFYSRKRIFREEFNNNAIITNMNLSFDTKEKIFTKFDIFSDKFREKYHGKMSFLPRDYLFFKFLNEEGHIYPYMCEEKKFKELEDIYWSLKDAKNYNSFINYLDTNILYNYEIYILPTKIVVFDIFSKMKYNRNAYLLTVDDEIDLIIKYFTKFFPKINVNPEYQYNLFILDMKEQNIEITFENVVKYIITNLNNEIKLKNNMFVINEEID